MKTTSKIGVLAIGIIFSISSCSSCANRSKGEPDGKVDTLKTTIDTSQKTIDTVKKEGTGSVKKDMVKK